MSFASSEKARKKQRKQETIGKLINTSKVFGITFYGICLERIEIEKSFSLFFPLCSWKSIFYIFISHSGMVEWNPFPYYIRIQSIRFI